MARLAADRVLSDWLESPRTPALPPAALRLARRVPALRAALEARLDDPVDRALAGLIPPPQLGAEPTLGRRVCLGLARADGGERLGSTEAAELEAAALGDPRWWVPAARLHVLASPERERRARVALSDQELPYVFPGELHPMQVELLAVGDRILTALHIDWSRKLADWALEALPQDLRSLGLWFWPHLGFFPDKRAQRPLEAALSARRLPDGARGLCAAYLQRVGVDGGAVVEAASPLDRLIWALAITGDRPPEAEPRVISSP